MYSFRIDSKQITFEMAVPKSINDVLRYGYLSCFKCGENMECSAMEQHCLDKHPDIKGKCFICGDVDVLRTESGKRYTAHSKTHIIQCCLEKKRTYNLNPRKRGREKSETIISLPKVISTKNIHNEQHNVIKVIDTGISVDEGTLDRMVNRRKDWLYGGDISDILSANVTVDNMEKIESFWRTFNFEIPQWLKDMMVDDDRIFLNQMEFHENANIDVFWGKVYGDPRLEFYHVFVHLCVFEKFAAIVRELHRVCTLLKYACMCDKHERNHVHFVLVAIKDAKIQLKLNTKTMGSCSVTKERDRYTTELAHLKMKVTPSWPDHRHFHMKPICSAMHLFNTIRYISTRESSETVTKEGQGGGDFKIVHSSTRNQLALYDKVRAFISSYVTNLDYNGSHFYIFRPIYPDAPLWFAAVSRRGMLEYVEYCMDKRSMADKMKFVIQKGTNRLHLRYRDIMEYLVQSAVPLQSNKYLYHSRCIDGEKRSERDEHKYIYLGKNEYIHMAKEDHPCCDEFSREIFFDSQPESLYAMNKRHRREFAMYTKWMAEKDAKIKQMADAAIMKDMEIKYLKEKVEMLYGSTDMERELRIKNEKLRTEIEIFIKELSKRDLQIEKLQHQLSHISGMLTKKSGPYLENNAHTHFTKNTY